MNPNKASPVHPSSFILPPSAVLALGAGVLALGGAFGWYWSQVRVERRTALELAGQNHFAAAEPSLRYLYERDPQDVAVLRALALGCLDARRFDEAEDFFNRWCERCPDQGEPYRRRLDLWMRQQKVSQALADADRLLRLEPGDFATRQLSAQLLVLVGRFAEAEPQARACQRAQPDNADVWFLLANIYHRQHRSKEAADLTERVLRVSPGLVPALQLRAEIHLDAGETEPGLRLLRQIGERPGQEAVPALYQLSLALARAGRDAEGKQVLADMRCRQELGLWSTDPHRDDNAGLQARVVEALGAAGKADDAVRFLKDILQRNPNAAGARQLLAGLGHGDTETRRRGDTEKK
jgi:predicted Zn-dependent protease